jgi:hypothetical protein
MSNAITETELMGLMPIEVQICIFLEEVPLIERAAADLGLKITRIEKWGVIESADLALKITRIKKWGAGYPAGGRVLMRVVIETTRPRDLWHLGMRVGAEKMADSLK